MNEKTPWPTEIRLRKDRRTLSVQFDDGVAHELPAEMLRVLSPSAEVQGHSPEQRRTVGGKRDVAIAALDPVGNYAVRIIFDDGHNTGLFSWAYLRQLGDERERAGRNISTSLPPRGCAATAESRSQGARHRPFRPKTKEPAEMPAGSLSSHPETESVQNDDLGSDLHPIVEVDDVVVGQPDAARRNRLPDRPRLVGAMDAVDARRRYRARGRRADSRCRPSCRPAGCGPWPSRARSSPPAASSPAIPPCARCGRCPAR